MGYDHKPLSSQLSAQDRTRFCECGRLIRVNQVCIAGRLAPGFPFDTILFSSAPQLCFVSDGVLSSPVVPPGGYCLCFDCSVLRPAKLCLYKNCLAVFRICGRAAVGTYSSPCSCRLLETLWRLLLNKELSQTNIQMLNQEESEAQGDCGRPGMEAEPQY